MSEPEPGARRRAFRTEVIAACSAAAAVVLLAGSQGTGVVHHQATGYAVASLVLLAGVVAFVVGLGKRSMAWVIYALFAITVSSIYLLGVQFCQELQCGAD